MEKQKLSGPAEQLTPAGRRTDGASRLRTARTTRQPGGPTAPLDSTNWFSLVMKEYGYLQTVIDKVDGQRFQIRNWTIAAAGILFTASLSTKIPLIALAGVVTTLFFAFLEIIYMQMMGDVIKRNNHLEELIDAYRRTGKEPVGYVFGVGQAFVGTFSFKKIPEIIFASGRIHVTAFYVGLMIATAAGGLAVALL